MWQMSHAHFIEKFLTYHTTFKQTTLAKHQQIYNPTAAIQHSEYNNTITQNNTNRLLFRPEQNTQHMKNSTEIICMPSLSIENFVEAIKQTELLLGH
jgi:branched-subunit amino acid aminotransferase/4-amino-4-deoxychorismate lyase